MLDPTQPIAYDALDIPEARPPLNDDPARWLQGAWTSKREQIRWEAGALRSVRAPVGSALSLHVPHVMVILTFQCARMMSPGSLVCTDGVMCGPDGRMEGQRTSVADNTAATLSDGWCVRRRADDAGLGGADGEHLPPGGCGRGSRADPAAGQVSLCKPCKCSRGQCDIAGPQLCVLNPPLTRKTHLSG